MPPTIEWINELQFVLMSKEQFAAVERAWNAIGGEVEDVGGDVHLFSIARSVVFRVRMELTH